MGFFAPSALTSENLRLMGVFAPSALTTKIFKTDGLLRAFGAIIFGCFLFVCVDNYFGCFLFVGVSQAVQMDPRATRRPRQKKLLFVGVSQAVQTDPRSTSAPSPKNNFVILEVEKYQTINPEGMRLSRGTGAALAQRLRSRRPLRGRRSLRR